MDHGKKEKKVMAGVRMEKWMKEEIEKEAENLDRSVSWVIERVLKNYFDAPRLEG